MTATINSDNAFQSPYMKKPQMALSKLRSDALVIVDNNALLHNSHSGKQLDSGNKQTTSKHNGHANISSSKGEKARAKLLFESLAQEQVRAFLNQGTLERELLRE